MNLRPDLDRAVDAAWEELERQATVPPHPYVLPEDEMIDGMINMRELVRKILETVEKES